MGGVCGVFLCSSVPGAFTSGRLFMWGVRGRTVVGMACSGKFLHIYKVLTLGIRGLGKRGESKNGLFLPT